MSPDQRRTYDRIYDRLMELTEKEDRGLITDDELREELRLEKEFDTLMNELCPHPPTILN